MLHSNLHWYALKTKPKSEKKIVERLTKYGLEAYVPLQKKVKIYLRKKKEYEIPLISCYIFARLNNDNYTQALQQTNVLQVIKHNGKPAIISEEDIHWLKKITGEDLNIEVEPIALHRGDKVMVTQGNLLGLQGIIADGRNDQFIVTFDNVGFSLRLQIESKYLDKIT